MILVTGAAGYIGSHCALNLLDKGYNVVIFDNLETGHLKTVETLKNLDTKGQIVDFIQGDLKNFDDINNVFKKHKIDGVIHFAANSIVEESIKNPEKYYKNNVLGGINLFNAMIENNVFKIVFSSSAAVYGNSQAATITEEAIKNPINPYGNSKLMIEKILADYDQAYGLKSIIFRYFNVAGADSLARIGEEHNPETHLVPNLLKATLEEGKTFKLLGNDYETKDGTCIRDYVYVSKIKDMLEAGHLSEYINQVELIMGNDYTSLDIAATLLKMALEKEVESFDKTVDFGITDTKEPQKEKRFDRGKKFGGGGFKRGNSSNSGSGGFRGGKPRSGGGSGRPGGKPNESSWKFDSGKPKTGGGKPKGHFKGK